VALLRIILEPGSGTTFDPPASRSSSPLEQYQESIQSPCETCKAVVFTCLQLIFSCKMRRPALILGSIVCYYLLIVLVVAKDSSDNDNVRLRVSIRKDTLSKVPSCQHTFSQVELLNLVRLMSLATYLIYVPDVLDSLCDI
jgi:hypothetical protein